MYKLFPFHAVAQFTFGLLPVELFAKILRFLDPKSLLKSCRVNKQWVRVIRGDPILRDRLRLQILKEKREFHQLLLNPGSTVSITRNTEVMFGSNVTKTVQRKTTTLEVPQYILRSKDTRKIGGGPMKFKSAVRSQPYKCLRM